jgi:Na+-transporting NADH:ubiquinone oxidoreductase subunit A
MQKLTIKKGYRFRMTGAPADTITELPDPPQVALLPEHIPHIKPRLRVAEGDRVSAGSVLFEDKRDPRLVFMSPGGGTVARIQFGPRRVIEAIVIDRPEASKEPRETFPTVDEPALERMARDRLVDHILQGGMWWVFRELPFRDLPGPDTTPPLILVGLDGREPFHPDPARYLEGQSSALAFGLKVLQKLAGDAKVVVFTGSDRRAVIDQCGGQLTHLVQGNYPSDDPGTVLYHIKSGPAENRAWFIAGQDLLSLARFLTEGQYPTHRVVTVGGSHAPVRQHYRIRLGAPLAQLVDGQPLDSGSRLIVGGVLRGFSAPRDGFMGLYETALNILPDGGPAEFLALYNPGFDKPSYSRVFLSKLNPALLVYNCHMHGGLRACISCMHCAGVCPVDLWPQLIHKAIHAKEVEEYLALGLLDCVECGLCSYVCPSKIELSQGFIDAKAAYAKELAAKSE